MQIQNHDAAQAIRSQAGLTQSEGFPQNLLPNCQPVMDMTPRNHRVVTFSLNLNAQTSASTSTIGTSSSTRDTFITAVNLQVEKDATCDVADGQVTLRAVFNGVATSIVSVPIMTLTAQSRGIAIPLVPPLKIDRGAAIQLTQGTFTAGKFIRNGTVLGYEVSPN